jgi:hypothetical protein
MASNPFNPNNPDREPAYPNTGFKLWAKDLPTGDRTHLDVAALGLAEGEYITAVRFEYGAVLRGFTTKNYADASLNGEHHEGAGISGSAVDWTPKPEDPWYALGAEQAEGLAPAVYLVQALIPMDESFTIHSSAAARIARNKALFDEDFDEVFTVPISTFTVTPREAPIAAQGSSYAPKTGDKSVPEALSVRGGYIAIGVLLLLAALSLFFVLKRRQRAARGTAAALAFIVGVGLIAGAMPADLFAAGGGARSMASSESGLSSGSAISREYAYTSGSSIDVQKPDIPEKLSEGGMLYELDKTAEQDVSADPAGKTVEAAVRKIVSVEQYERSRGREAFAPEIDFEREGYAGTLTLDTVRCEPVHISLERKVDKTETLTGLSINDITELPEEKEWEITDDSTPGATQTTALRRAGMTQAVAGYDQYGIPNRWDVTIVYRGLEDYLQAGSYSAEATYQGEVSAVSRQMLITALFSPTMEEKPQEEILELATPLDESPAPLTPLQIAMISIGSIILAGLLAIIIYLIAKKRKEKKAAAQTGA